MIRKGDFFYEVGNAHRIIVFEKTTLRMEVNPRMEVTFYKAKSM